MAIIAEVVITLAEPEAKTVLHLSRHPVADVADPGPGRHPVAVITFGGMQNSCRCTSDGRRSRTR
eukprot:14610175-Alexandrium_andersonii.AAC.1